MHNTSIPSGEFKTAPKALAPDLQPILIYNVKNNRIAK